jgi:hypothetical protein
VIYGKRDTASSAPLATRREQRAAWEARQDRHATAGGGSGNGGSTGGNGGRGGHDAYTTRQVARYGSNGVASTINSDGNGNDNFDRNGNGGNGIASAATRVLTLARRSTKKREDTRNLVRNTLIVICSFDRGNEIE